MRQIPDAAELMRVESVEAALVARDLKLQIVCVVAPRRLTGRSLRLPWARYLATAILLSLIALWTTTAGPRAPGNLEPDGAPDRQSDGPGVPPPIVWPAPQLGKGPFLLESAEERHLRVVVMSEAAGTSRGRWRFCPTATSSSPSGPARLRIVRNGVLDPTRWPAFPRSERGLQGLMDVALHPQFAENQLVYFTYHKPIGTPRRAAGDRCAPRTLWDGRR